MKNLKLKSGDCILGTINGKEISGAIFIQDAQMYFCQDSFDGKPSPNKLGHRYSWGFKEHVPGKYTSDVTIIEILKRRVKSSVSTGIKVIKEQTVLNGRETYIFKKINYKRYFDIKVGMFPDFIIKSTLLFNGIHHPDCCGSVLLYNFCNSDSKTYSRYTDITAKELAYIKDTLIVDCKAAKLVHLSHRQTEAIKFVNELGFKRQFKYKNNNSGNTIYVYHLNPKKI